MSSHLYVKGFAINREKIQKMFSEQGIELTTAEEINGAVLTVGRQVDRRKYPIVTGTKDTTGSPKAKWQLIIVLEEDEDEGKLKSSLEQMAGKELDPELERMKSVLEGPDVWIRVE